MKLKLLSMQSASVSVRKITRPLLACHHLTHDLRRHHEHGTKRTLIKLRMTTTTTTTKTTIRSKNNHRHSNSNSNSISANTLVFLADRGHQPNIRLTSLYGPTSWQISNSHSTLQVGVSAVRLPLGPLRTRRKTQHKLANTLQMPFQL